MRETAGGLKQIHSDRPDCFYCSKNEKLDSLMIEAAALQVSTLYVNRDQTHGGRCIVAYRRHATELFQLDRTELRLFMEDVSLAAEAIYGAFRPDKMNYGIYGDLVPHLHVHLVPKYKGTEEWGEAFVNAPPSRKTLDPDGYRKIVEIIRSQLKR
ncbi:HIT family protein [Cohnella thermotolerans]|jgi:ATP adenylyltransferase|uniref:HIT family protein n=1 Tax=Cohnella thermotolerans TaxID=329858 RepID=UPI0006846CDC|nr:HIT family protein [Cohnella thermotolerans]